jgi:Secretion system C-terminal sorting domain
MKKTFILSSLAFTMFSAHVKAQDWDTIVSGIPMSTIDGLIPSCFEIFPLENGTLLSSTAGSIHRSTNYGDSWTTLPFIYSPTGIAMNGYNGFTKVNDGRILALGFGGLLGNAISKSDDDGMTWVASFSGIDPSSNGNVTIEDASVAPNGTIYIVSRQNAGVYASTDNGDTWEEKSTDISESLWSILVVDDNTILVGATNGIHRSTDGGTTWTHVLDTSGSSAYVMKMVKNSAGTIYAGLASGVVRKSVDNGLTFTNTSLTGAGASVYDMAIDQNDNMYIAIYLGGLMKFDNTETPVGVFGYEANGLVNTRIMDITIDESGSEPIFYVASSNTTGTGGCMYRTGIESGVSVSEVIVENTISLFPNPTTDQLIISGIENNGQNIIKILSVDGRIVKQALMTSNIIHVGELPAGVYVLHIDGVATAHRFIKE